ncbi:MAG: nuclear transport factor 2 family protein [Actinomycetota bacterium]|nr:nuclear transport factor 2 family protein [Actinomycetota bacterium]
MSANLDLVRSIVADWERGDFRSTEWADPNIEFRGTVESPLGATGVPAMAASWREWLREWEDFHVTDVEEYRVVDQDRVLVLHRFTARGKASGLQVEQTLPRGAMLFRIRDGKVTELRLFASDRDRALADLGLAPEDAPDPEVGTSSH